MTVITVERALAEGATAGRLFACANWNIRAAGRMKSRAAKARHMDNARALRAVAKDMQSTEVH
ncbi:hypothetical protein HW532_12690 [Kaustia mangrovi]|uniref:Uncharacterized protein n=1 Tax=Kaustia mangrovi TaxID=2593653 RepID=A0A7S8C4X3_9HYPH|nr:hypothetical protein [Kaustia mangrovi]QPC43475.1 hypothetical protein HW532_12690 [Kaustia mangrovi]